MFDLERMNELELYIEEGPNSGFRDVLVTDGKHPYAGAGGRPAISLATSTPSRIPWSISSKPSTSKSSRPPTSKTA